MNRFQIAFERLFLNLNCIKWSDNYNGTFIPRLYTNFLKRYSFLREDEKKTEITDDRSRARHPIRQTTGSCSLKFSFCVYLILLVSKSVKEMTGSGGGGDVTIEKSFFIHYDSSSSFIICKLLRELFFKRTERHLRGRICSAPTEEGRSQVESRIKHLPMPLETFISRL